MNGGAAVSSNVAVVSEVFKTIAEIVQLMRKADVATKSRERA